MQSKPHTDDTTTDAKRVPEQNKTVRFVIIALIVGMVGVGLFFWHASYRHSPDPGEAVAREYIRDYIKVLNANQLESLRELVGREDSEDALKRLRLYGDRRLTDVNILLVQEFADVYRSWITAQDAEGAVVDMYQVIGWNGRHWTMAPVYTGPIPPPPQ